jgi:hypothetical protein
MLVLESFSTLGAHLWLLPCSHLPCNRRLDPSLMHFFVWSEQSLHHCPVHTCQITALILTILREKCRIPFALTLLPCSHLPSFSLFLLHSLFFQFLRHIMEDEILVNLLYEKTVKFVGSTTSSTLLFFLTFRET